jgi:hypothetical protein
MTAIKLFTTELDELYNIIKTILSARGIDIDNIREMSLAAEFKLDLSQGIDDGGQVALEIAQATQSVETRVVPEAEMAHVLLKWYRFGARWLSPKI